MAKKKRRKGKLKPLSKTAKLRQSRAAKAIRTAFDKTKKRLKKSDDWRAETKSYYRVVLSKAGTVDGMLRITNLPPNVPIETLLFALSADDSIALPARYKKSKDMWTEIGFLGSFDPEEEPDEEEEGDSEDYAERLAKRYSRRYGLDIIQLNSQNLESFAGQMETAQWFAEKHIPDKKPTQITVRFFWGKRPKRKRLK